jgi:hypothetical protein
MWMMLCAGAVCANLIACGLSHSQALKVSSQVVGVHRVAGDVYMLDTDTTKFEGGNMAVQVGRASTARSSASRLSPAFALTRRSNFGQSAPPCSLLSRCAESSAMVGKSNSSVRSI